MVIPHFCKGSLGSCVLLYVLLVVVGQEGVYATTAILLEISPLYMGVSLWKALFVVSQKWSCPTALVVRLLYVIHLQEGEEGVDTFYIICYRSGQHIRCMMKTYLHTPDKAGLKFQSWMHTVTVSISVL